MAVRSRLKVLIAQYNVKRLKANQPTLTLRRLAEETGLALSTINGLTTPRASRVDFKTLNALCEYFDVQPGEILEYLKDNMA
ncbi:helix-turn-helix domain-containing protein [Herpetosiphon geysericola]|uniref:helix-turn-helix domain-containing protein n=1 Tax=Herpetosiphon geysericola TaxID=70996 RepID=UPI0006C8F903|nr:helix-turn-helix domain-containing protein [Herpetosiphon geysericola]